MINNYQKITRKEYENLRNFAFRTAKNTLEYYNASDYSVSYTHLTLPTN